jgi:hypothetical protein
MRYGDGADCLAHREEVKNVKFSWDGEYIAAAGDDRCIDIVS